VERIEPEVAREAGRVFLRGLFFLAVATAIAACVAAGIYAFVWHADFLTGAAGSVAKVVLSHDALTIAAATSPLFAALLVGYGYMQRGMRRRAAERAAAAAARDAVPAPAGDGGKP
jgi:hypothetical protein